MQIPVEQDFAPTVFAAAKSAQRNAYISALLVFLVFSMLFLSFRSKQYTAVDGAVRCLGVYHQQALFFHENNHLLYPANIFFWSRALNIIGVKASNALEFLSISQAMNCTAAAGCLALLYIFTWLATSSLAISWCAVLALGFARAFLAHATNSAEPIVGLFHSFLALLIVILSLRRGRIAPLFLGGLFFALAMATYQSMVLIAPLAGLLCLGWPHRTASGRNSTALAILRATVVTAGTIVGVAAIYGAAYWYQGARTASQMIRMFLVIGGHQEVYGGFRISSFVNAPVGFVGNILPAIPESYAAFRSFVKTGTLWDKARLSLSAILVYGICGLVLSGVFRNARSFSRATLLLVLACIATLAITAWPLLYGGPLYDKFWLQPLSLTIFAMGVLYAVQSQTPQRGPMLRLALAVFLLVEMTTNLVWLVRDHTHDTEGLKEAAAVARHVGPKDAIVIDFDPISSLYFALWGTRENVIVLPAATAEYASQWMAQAAIKTRENQGNVYFLGILDQSEPTWDAFLGNRVGIRYHDFDRYRQNAQIVEIVSDGKSRITLRRMTAE
jgi:hypothetical protein